MLTFGHVYANFLAHAMQVLCKDKIVYYVYILDSDIIFITWKI